jgi:hypothetical protein
MTNWLIGAGTSLLRGCSKYSAGRILEFLTPPFDYILQKTVKETWHITKGVHPTILIATRNNQTNQKEPNYNRVQALLDDR